MHPGRGRFKPAAVLLAALLWLAASGVAGAQPRWPHQHVAEPFMLHADFPLDDHADLITEMERLQYDLQQALEVAPPRESIHLFLFQHRSTYQEYVRLYYPHVPYRRALFIKERGPGMVFAYRTDKFDVDVRHESTHALLHGTLPLVPLWLDEGLAEYFEVPPAQRAFDHPHLGKTKWSVRLGRIPRIDRLERLNSLNQMGPAEYRDAWAWVHFMIHGPTPAGEELRGFLADLQAHAPPGILSRRLRARIPNLERQLADHFKGWKR